MPTKLLSRLVIFSVVLTIAGCAGQPSREEYANYTATLIALGDLRTERAPRDAPYTNEDLVRNFSRIALRHERDISLPGSDANASTNPLQRWENPIRYRMIGSGFTLNDRREIRTLMDRVAELTGREVIEADTQATFLIFLTDPQERDAASDALHEVHPSLGRSFDTWADSSDIVCMATNLFGRDDPNEIVFGMVSIGSEVAGLLRQSCLHEEIIQALGLGNDHPAVRPSIFNDDEEFALMTEHDEFLLQVLYDPRLKTGMSEAEALPIVQEIVREIRPDGAV